MFLENFRERQIPVEVLESPFTEEPDHSYLFEQTEESLKAASGSINALWARLRKIGFDHVLTRSISLGLPVEICIESSKNNVVSYDLKYQGETRDIFGQKVDVFEFSKKAEDQSKPNAQSLRITTLAGRYIGVSELVAFRIEDEELPIQVQHFQFIHGELAALAQVSKPKVLFPNIESDDSQFIELGMLNDKDITEKSLVVRAGVYGNSTENQGSYRNDGGTLTRSRSLRVVNVLTGEMELVSQTDEDLVINSFRLYHAVHNVAHFTRATDY